MNESLMKSPKRKTKRTFKTLLLELVKVSIPHISLVVFCTVYISIGSLVFNSINSGKEVKEFAQNDLIEAQKALASDIWEIKENGGSSPEDLKKALENYTERLYELYQKYPNDALDPLKINQTTSLMQQLLFAASTVTSIGYGGAPTTTTGRAICMIYISLGLPVMLLTIGDLACFSSELIHKFYMLAKKTKFELTQIIKNGFSEKKKVSIAGGKEQTAEFLWAYLEKAQIVEPPVLLAYALLICYLAFGAALLCQYEKWPYLDCMYYSTISVLTTGFGDLMPENDTFMFVSILYVIVGLVLATSVVEMAGKKYLHRLHTMGRQLSGYDPMSWLKAVQRRRIYKMKQMAMSNLFNSITATLRVRFDDGNTNAEQPAPAEPEIKKEEESPEPEEKKSVSGIGPSPKHFQVTHATASTVILDWESPLEKEYDETKYWFTLTYKPRTVRKRHIQTFGKMSITNHTTVVDFITGTNYEIKDLQSFTLYQFTLCTTTRFGPSNEVTTEEYTEPSTVPQSVRIENVCANMATVGWDAPIRNNENENYSVHYTSEPAPPFKEWININVDSLTRFTMTTLKPDTHYVVCVSANQNIGLAAISKSVRFITPAANSEDEESTTDKKLDKSESIEDCTQITEMTS